MGKLDDKVAVITGGASGIGASTAEQFVQEGARVVVADVQEEEGRAVAKPLGDAAVFKRTDVIRERHRHRYEFNNNYMQQMMNAGLRFSGFSSDGLVELVELADHPFFIASQYHPEFRSTPRDGHPLFTGFIEAARKHASATLPEAAGA